MCIYSFCNYILLLYNNYIEIGIQENTRIGINAYTRLLLLLLFIDINAYTINTYAGLNKCTLIIVKSPITTNPHSHLNPPPPNEPLHRRAMPLH